MQLPLATDTGRTACKLRISGRSRCSTSDWCRSWTMGSGCPSAASSCGPGDPPILSDRSCSTSNTFLVAKDGRVQGSCLHLPSPSLRDWAPDRAFRPRQSPCAYRLPTGMDRRFPRHHPATALAGALGCRGSARGRRLWKRGCSPRPQRR